MRLQQVSLSLLSQRMKTLCEGAQTMKIVTLFIAVLMFTASLASPLLAKSSLSEADRELLIRARKECNSWKHYPDGASIHINYAQGWFRCENRQDRKRNNKRN
jgi:hypothetical protein